MTIFTSCDACIGAEKQSQQQQPLRRRLLTWSNLLLTSAFVDIASCWTIILQGLSDDPNSLPENVPHQAPENNRLQPGDIPGIMFVLLCFCEAIRRAKDAKQRASDDAFLTKCEAQIGRVLTFTTFPSIQSFGNLSSAANFSSIGLHLLGHEEKADHAPATISEQETDRETFETHEPPSGTIVWRLLRKLQAVQLDRHKIRIWTHASLTFVAWMSLLPLRLPIDNQNGDCAIASSWIAFTFSFCHERYESLGSYLSEVKHDFIWHTALPFAVRKPRLFYARLRKVMRGIRWTKFAIPMFKFADKLRLRSLDSWRSRMRSNQIAEKVKALERKSVFKEQLRSLEQEWKIKKKIQAWKLATYSRAIGKLQKMKRVTTAARIQKNFDDEKETIQHQRETERKISDLKSSPERPSYVHDAKEVYEHFVSLRRSIFGREKLNGFLAQYLLKPDSRFAFLWKTTVLLCVLLEVARLSISWHLSGHMDANATFGELFHMILPQWGGDTAALMGKFIEDTISTICIWDIPIWLQIGEYDEYGLLVPKPFFSRYILPGTLVQVLDHPTLFDEVSLAVWRTAYIANIVGYSRFIRWIIILGPAASSIFEQTKSYFLCSICTSVNEYYGAQKAL